MDPETRKALDDLRRSLHKLESQHVALADQQDGMAAQMREMAQKQRAMAETQREMAEDTSAMTRNFDNFLARFEEVVEMTVQHDTDQLRRVAAVEAENQKLLERIEAIERRLDQSPAA